MNYEKEAQKFLDEDLEKWKVSSIAGFLTKIKRRKGDIKEYRKKIEEIKETDSFLSENCEDGTTSYRECR